MARKHEYLHTWKTWGWVVLMWLSKHGHICDLCTDLWSVIWFVICELICDMWCNLWSDLWSDMWSALWSVLWSVVRYMCTDMWSVTCVTSSSLLWLLPPHFLSVCLRQWFSFIDLSNGISVIFFYFNQVLYDDARHIYHTRCYGISLTQVLEHEELDNLTKGHSDQVRCYRYSTPTRFHRRRHATYFWWPLQECTFHVFDG